MANFGFPGFPWAPGVPEAHTREDGGILWPPRQGYSKTAHMPCSALRTLKKTSLTLPRVWWDAGKVVGLRKGFYRI